MIQVGFFLSDVEIEWNDWKSGLNRFCVLIKILKKGENFMKTWKLVSGILSIVLFIIVAFQSCTVGLVNTLEENGEFGGSAGIIVAIMMMAGGI